MPRNNTTRGASAPATEGFFKGNQGPFGMDYMKSLADAGRLELADLSAYSYEPEDKAVEKTTEIAAYIVGLKDPEGFYKGVHGPYDVDYMKTLADGGRLDVATLKSDYTYIGDDSVAAVSDLTDYINGLTDPKAAVYEAVFEALRYSSVIAKTMADEVVAGATVADVLAKYGSGSSEPTVTPVITGSTNGTLCFLNEDDIDDIDNNKVVDVMVVPGDTTIIMSKDWAISQVKDIKIDGHKKVAKDSFTRMKMRKDWAGDITLFKGKSRK